MTLWHLLIAVYLRFLPHHGFDPNNCVVSRFFFWGGGVGGIRITILEKLVKSIFCPILLKFTLKTVETVDKDFSPGGLNIARSHAEVI